MNTEMTAIITNNALRAKDTPDGQAIMAFIKMKSEECKEQLVGAKGNEVFELQGAVRKLREVISDLESARNTD